MTQFRIGRVCKTKGMDDRVGWGRGGHEGQEGRKGGQKHGGERDNWPRGQMDKASAYGAGDCRFESCRGQGLALNMSKHKLIGRWLNVVRTSSDNSSTAILPRVRIPVAEEMAVQLCPCMACTLSQLSPPTSCVLPGLDRWESIPGGSGQG